MFILHLKDLDLMDLLENKHTSISAAHAVFNTMTLLRLSAINMCPWSTKAVISSTGIFVEIAKNTFYGSELLIFILCQRSLGH